MTESSVRHSKATVGRAVGAPRSLPPLAWAAIALAAVGDATRKVGLQAEITVFVAIFCSILFFAGIVRGFRGIRFPLVLVGSLLGFLGTTAIGLLRTPNMASGLQNISVYISFAFALIYFATMSSRLEITGALLIRRLRIAGVAASTVYLIGVARYGVNTDLGWMSARASAGVLMIGIVSSVALWVCRQGSIIPVLYIGLGLTSSLSRAQLGEMLMILIVAVALRATHPLRAVFRLMSAALIAGFLVRWAYYQYPAFRRRFEVGDGYQLGGFTVGSSGRERMWSTTIESWKSDLIFGNGTGHSEYTTFLRHPPNAHPHNDYLRLLNDVGLLGAALFLTVMIILLRCFVRAARLTPDNEGRTVHLAAIFAWIFLATEMFINNPIIAIFLMLPLAAVFGNSLAASIRATDERTSTTSVQFAATHGPACKKSSR